MLVSHKPRGRKVSREFRDWLTALRKRAGLSKNRLADLASVDQGTVSRVEAGLREPTDEFLARVSRHLGIDATRLITAAAASRAGSDLAYAEIDINTKARSGHVSSSQEGANHGQSIVSGETMAQSGFQARVTEGMPSPDGLIEVPGLKRVPVVLPDNLLKVWGLMTPTERGDILRLLIQRVAITWERATVHTRELPLPRWPATIRLSIPRLNRPRQVGRRT